MESLVVVLTVLLLLDLAAWRWGADTTDGFDSPEWVNRREWPGFATRR